MVLYGACTGGCTITISPYLLPSALPISLLSRISPSKFHLFRECKLRACLESNKIQGLLPQSPSMHCGTVIHKIIEKTGKGEIKGDDDFERFWDKYIGFEEEKMKHSWIERHLVPLERSTPNYDLKKYQCLLTIRSIKQRSSSTEITGPKGLAREIWLETQDKAVGGYIDAIIPTNRGDIIIDYKTGNINEQTKVHKLDIKEIYKIQLKLYAAIYNSTYRKWPISLQIVGMDGVPNEIEFDPEECANLLTEAFALLNYVNSIIKRNLNETNDLLASPSPEACRFCLYRPSCQPYLEKKDKNWCINWPRDAIGFIEEKKILGNGLMLVKIKTKNADVDSITIRGLDRGRHPALNNNSDGIAIFSMKTDSSPNSFKEGLLTTVYSASGSR